MTQPEGLGTRLRALRARADLSGKELAAAAGWDQSKVSRIERGQQVPKAPDIDTWARVCGATDTEVRELLSLQSEARIAHATFSDRMKRGQAEVQKSYTSLAASASLIEGPVMFVPPRA